MPRRSDRPPSPPLPSSSRTGRGLVLGACAVLGAGVGWALWPDRSEPEPARPPATPARSAPAARLVPTAPSAAQGLAARESLARLTDAGVPRPQPWEVTRENTAPPPDGHTPAYKARPPPPDAEQPLLAPRPAPRPDPALTRPALDNPGGVNGDRPPRPVPGLE